MTTVRPPSPGGDVTDLRVLVAGASGGIGRFVARSFLERGARVAMTYRYHPAAVEQLLTVAPDRASSHSLDLTDAESCYAVVNAVTDAFSGLDVVVYAAGPHVPMSYLSHVSPDAMRDQLLTDTGGFFNLAHASLRPLRLARGNIVAITTSATERYPTRDGLSAAPKAAIEAIARGLAVEEGRYGVRVNCVGPGMLTDGMADRLIASGELDERALDAARSRTPLGRFGSAQDVAEAVLFLASASAGFISGQKLNVDGGYTA